MPTDLENSLEDLKTELGDSTVLHRVGERHLRVSEQRRKIVWVPKGGDFDKSFRGGSKLQTADAVPVTRDRIIMARRERVEAHIYAEDDETTEILFKNLLAAISIAWGSAVDWEDRAQYAIETQDSNPQGPTDPHDSFSRQGAKYRLAITMRYAVTDEVSALRVVGGFEATDKLNTETDVVIQETT